MAFGLAYLVPDPVLSAQLLFRIRAFELLSLTGFLLGLTLFAANIYLPQHRNASGCTPSCPAGRRIQALETEQEILKRAGVDFELLDSGCCGMAGAFGFEKQKYATSIAIGELELLPAVRNAPADWRIIADGFSCREQIQQCTGRTALHLAEVIQLALGKKA